MKVDTGISSDYAVVTISNDEDIYEFYYGYEVTLEDEWCFRASHNKEVTCQIKASDLSGAGDSYNPVECLLSGMAHFIAKGL